MNVSVVRGGQELIDRYGDEWRALCAEGPCSAPFYSPDWVRAYHDAFAPTAELVFMVVRNGERLRGLLPLVARRWKGVPWGRRWLQSMGNEHSPRFDVIHGMGDRDTVMNALVSFLHSWRGWDVIQCRTVSERGFLSQLAAQLGEEDAPVARYHHIEVPYVDLATAQPDVATLISHLGKKARTKMRRYVKQIAEHGEIRSQIYTADSGELEVREQLETMYELEASGWKGEVGGAIVSNPSTRTFYDAITRTAHEASQLRLFRLEVDGEPVAIELAVEADSALYLLKYGINEARRDCGPGHLLTLYHIASAADGGYAMMDLGGRMESYKKIWTKDTRTVHSCMLFRPTPRGRLLRWLVFGLRPTLGAGLQNLPIPGKLRTMLEIGSTPKVTAETGRQSGADEQPLAEQVGSVKTAAPPEV